MGTTSTSPGSERRRRQRMAVLQAGQADQKPARSVNSNDLLLVPEALNDGDQSLENHEQVRRRLALLVQHLTQLGRPAFARPGRGTPPVRHPAVGNAPCGSGVSVSPEGRRSGHLPGRSFSAAPPPTGSCPGLLCRGLRRGQRPIEPLAQDVGRRRARLPRDHLTSAEHEQGGDGLHIEALKTAQGPRRRRP